MSYGFQSFNGSAMRQIDQDFSCDIVTQISLLESNRVYLSTGQYDFTLGFVRPATEGGRLWTSSNLTSSFNFANYIFTSSTNFYSVNKAIVSGLGPSSVTHGLRVFKADGSIAFDSGYQYVHPVALVYVPVNGTKLRVSLAPPSHPKRKRMVKYSEVEDNYFRWMGTGNNLSPLRTLVVDFIDNNNFDFYFSAPNNTAVAQTVTLDASFVAAPNYPIYIYEVYIP